MQRNRSFAILATLVLGLAIIPLGGSPLTLTPDKVLRITFNTDPSSWILNSFGTPNVLEFQIPTNGAFIPAEPVNSVMGSLYDGDTFLGSSTSAFSTVVGAFPIGIPLMYWSSPGTILTGLNPAPIDFTSILDGTIQGRLDVTISAGSMTFDYPFPPGQAVFLWDYDTPNTGTGRVGSTTNISAELIDIPEPGSWLLMCAGLILLVYSRRRFVGAK